MGKLQKEREKAQMTLHDVEIDQIMDRMEAERAMNNRWHCDLLRAALKCPKCAPFAKKMIARIIKGDKKITALDEILCA